jgi:hypothetical protein
VCLPLALLMLAATSSAREMPWLRWYEVVEVSAPTGVVPVLLPESEPAAASPLSRGPRASEAAFSEPAAALRFSDHVEVSARADSVPVASPESSLVAAAPLPLPAPLSAIDHVEVSARADSVPVASPESSLVAAAPLRAASPRAGSGLVESSAPKVSRYEHVVASADSSTLPVEAPDAAPPARVATLMPAAAPAMAAEKVNPGPDTTVRSSPEYGLRASPPPEAMDYLLVGAILNGREAMTFDVLRHGDELYLPLDSLMRLGGCELEVRDGVEHIVTPLGARPVDIAEVVEADGLRYVHARFLRRELGTRIEFVPELFAVRFLFPWSPGQPLRASVLAEAPVPEADDLPPSLSVSSARVDAAHVRRPEQTQTQAQTQLNALVNGRIAGGRWRARAGQSVGGATRLDEYAWTREFGQTLGLLGHQRVNLHPLLDTLEMTGAQGAWTNQPLETFNRSGQPAELLPRSLRASTTISGRGPIAGVAELRVEGLRVARQTISLDGYYEFVDVTLPSRQSSRIEVYVYDRFDMTAPVEVHDHTRGATDQMLSAGASVVMGGVGDSGNYLDQLMSDTAVSGGMAAFAQSRYGLSDRVTVEAAVQSRGGHSQAMAGVVASIGSSVAGAATVAIGGGSLGWDLDVQGYFQRWQVTARSQRRGAGFSGVLSAERENHQAEVLFRATGNLDLGFVAVSRDDYAGKTQYVLPTISWQPVSRTWLRARPDYFGRYRVDFSWAVADRSRLGVSYANRGLLVTASHSLTRTLQANVSAEWHEFLGTRQQFQVSWAARGSRQLGLTGALRRTDGRIGAMVGAQAVVAPGVLASLQLENDPNVLDPQRRYDPRISLRLSADLAFARGRVLAGNTYALSTTRGAVGGRVKAPAEANLVADDLAGLPVLIDGKPLTRTERGGRFFVGNLRPGVYQVAIDPEGLPIELTLEESSRRARVEPGAVTGVEFATTLEYGFAGRVTVEGQYFANAIVELVDAAGAVIQTVRTDRFGLYRFDRVVVGRYVVRLAAANAPRAEITWPARTVEVNDFLFGQDLELSRTFRRRHDARCSRPRDDRPG